MEEENYAYNFGHPMSFNKEDFSWHYIDGKLNTDEVYQNLVCPRCNNKPTKEGHDPCIKNLKGVAFACCGHGINNKNNRPYICFEGEEKRVVRFDSTEEILEYVKENEL